MRFLLMFTWIRLATLMSLIPDSVTTWINDHTATATDWLDTTATTWNLSTSLFSFVSGVLAIIMALLLFLAIRKIWRWFAKIFA